MAAGALKADLRLPGAIYERLTILLLLAIGLKGGIELAGSPLLQVVPSLVAVTLMGFLLGGLAYGWLRLSRRLPRADAASIAAHYGSVCVGTFAIAYLARLDITYEPYAAAFVVVLEIPAIRLGIVLARGLHPTVGWGGVMRVSRVTQ